MAFRLFRRNHYADRPSDKVKETPGSFLKSLLILALAAWILRSLIVAPFSVLPGSSPANGFGKVADIVFSNAVSRARAIDWNSIGTPLTPCATGRLRPRDPT